MTYMDYILGRNNALIMRIEGKSLRNIRNRAYAKEIKEASKIGKRMVKGEQEKQR
jgi:hypothetical protein